MQDRKNQQQNKARAKLAFKLSLTGMSLMVAGMGVLSIALILLDPKRKDPWIMGLFMIVLGLVLFVAWRLGRKTLQ